MGETDMIPGPFGLAPGFYDISNCKPLHRKHKEKIGSEDWIEQVVDLAFDLKFKEKAARGMKFHAALFVPFDQASVKADSQGKFEGMAEVKEFEPRRVGKIGLGDDLDYQTKDYDLVVHCGMDEVAKLEPKHGFEMKSAEAHDDGIATIIVRCIAKNIGWDEFMLGCMLPESDLNVRFIESGRPKQAKIEDIVSDDDDDEAGDEEADES